MALTLSEILSAKDGKTTEVKVPEWGGSVFLRVMSGSERDEYDNCLLTRLAAEGKRLKENRGIRQKLLMLTLCDESGARMLATEADANKLFAKSATVLQRLFEASQSLNALNDEAVEVLGKNSDGTGAVLSG